MGLRERFRARRKLPPNHTPPPPSTNTQPSSAHSNAPDGSSSLFVSPFGERSATALDHVQDDVSSHFKLFERSSYGSEVMHEAPTSSSGTSSLRLAASRMGRSIKDKILRRDPRDSSWGNDVDQHDVPEISEADCRIAEYAAATAAQESITRSPALASADVDTLTKHSCGDLVPMGAEIPDGVKCNDGCISLVVPDGWAAIRMPDCFCLFTDMAVGYVRTVPANEAVNALVETDRLQVMSAVTATSSPVFVAPDLIQVEYSASEGVGKGIVKFANGFGNGACIVALCGPVEMKDMIDRSLRHLVRTVMFMSLYHCKIADTFDTPAGDEDILTSANGNPTGAGLSGQCLLQ